jgi:hypothetical protein
VIPACSFLFYRSPAAWYALSYEELDEILLCNDLPVLEAYFEALFLVAMCLWKFKMPIETKNVFQTQVFHQVSATEVLQKHLGMTMTQQLFDMNNSFHVLHM